MRLPWGWNRSRATALGATALLHLAVILWLLALKFDLPEKLAKGSTSPGCRNPKRSLPPPPPVVSEPPPPRVEPITAAPLALPVPEFAPPASPDWSSEARDYAKGLIAAPPYRPFGEFPKGPQERPRDQYPASIWPQPLPRVGTTVTTPEGETIMWVSDYCYVSLSRAASPRRGFTMRETASGPASSRSSAARKRRAATCSTRSSARSHRKNRAATRKASAYPAPDELPVTRTRTRNVREILRPQ